MRAVVQYRYGAPTDVLRRRYVDKPVAADDEVLVRVQAASLHPDVWHVVHGLPYFVRIMGAGLLSPKDPIPGTDVAGWVEAVGPNVTRFQPGDAVFGESVRGHQWHNGGAFAEYAAVPEGRLALKPANITFEQAAAVPTSGFIALRNLGAQGAGWAGHNVLVNGAGGGVGVIAVQLAKAYGAQVTAVDSAGKLDMLRSIGADRVIDYTQEDFTEGSERYDLIYDVPGNHTFAECRRALTPAGRYILIGHEEFGALGARWIGRSMGHFIKMLALSPFERRLRNRQASSKIGDPLPILTTFIEAGQLTPIVDRTFPLGQVPEAIRYLETGDVQGKVVITV